MGTDIYPIVELQGEDGRWKAVLPPGEDRYSSWDFGRSYDCFAVLAGVRNGVGFAGVDTGDGFKPISEPRGLPEDRDLRNENRYGEYGYSWLLVSEILAYDWEQKTRKRGWIPKDQFEQSDGPIASGQDCAHQWRIVSAGAVYGDARKDFVQAEWEVTYREACGSIFRFVGIIQDTLPGVEPERIRIIFGFA